MAAAISVLLVGGASVLIPVTAAGAQDVQCDADIVTDVAIVLDRSHGTDDELDDVAVDVLVDLASAALGEGQLDRALVIEPPVNIGGDAVILADSAQTGPDLGALRGETLEEVPGNPRSAGVPDFDAAVWLAMDSLGAVGNDETPYGCSGVGLVFVTQHPAEVASSPALAQADLRGVTLGLGAIGEVAVEAARPLARFDEVAEILDTASLPALSRLLPAAPVQNLIEGTNFGSGHLPVARWYLDANREPFLLQGYSSRQRLNLEVPQGWLPVGQSQLELRYTSSELARNDSSLLVSVDGNPMFTELVGDGQDVDLISAASLPAEDFELLLSTSTPLDFDNDCIDPEHVGRWIEIAENAHLLSELEFIEPTIDNFVSSIADISSLTERPLTFILPENPSLEVIDAVGVLAVAINEGGVIHDVQVVVGDPPTSLDGPAVIIGAPDPTLDAAELFVAESDGWPVLSLAGSRELLQAAARAVNDDAFAPLLDVGRASVSTAGAPEIPEPDSLFTLESLGFRDRTARGTGEQSMGYHFDLPISWQPSEMRIRIIGSYAASLSTVDTDLTVSVNGQAIGSTTLEDETGRIDTTIAVPPSTLRPGRNFLRFSADLGRIPLVCEGLSSTDRWISIHNSTTVSVGYEQGRNSLDLGDLPHMLAERSDAAALDLVLPNNATADDLRMALQLLTAIAEGGNGTSPRIVSAGAADRSKHLILLGTGSDQPLLSALSDSLTIDPSIGLPDRVGELRAEASAGSLEILWSPWADRRVVLAVTGADRSGVENAVHHLIDPELQSNLRGRAMLVGATASESVDLALPGALAIVDDGSEEALAEYEGWLREQVDAPFDPATGTVDLTTRRLFAGLIALALAGMGLVGLIRKRNGSGGHGHGSGHDDDGDDDDDAADGDGAAGPGDGGGGGEPDGGSPADPSPDPAPDNGPNSGGDDAPTGNDPTPAGSNDAPAAQPAPDGPDQEDDGESDAADSGRVRSGALFNGIVRPVPDAEQPERDARPPAPVGEPTKAMLDLEAHAKDVVIDLRRPGVQVQTTDVDLVAALTVSRSPDERKRSVLARRLSRKQRMKAELDAVAAAEEQRRADEALAEEERRAGYLEELRSRLDTVTETTRAHRSPIQWSRPGDDTGSSS